MLMLVALYSDHVLVGRGRTSQRYILFLLSSSALSTKIYKSKGQLEIF